MAGFLLVSAVILAVSYGHKPLPRLQKIVTRSQSPDELIDRLDKAMESINAISNSSKGLAADASQAIPEPKKLSLSGIIATIDKPLAIVNGQVVGIGDKIEGFEIIDIKEKSIVVRDKNGEEKVTHLYENQ